MATYAINSSIKSFNAMKNLLPMLLLSANTFSCKSPEPTVPEQISKTWIARTVKENNIVVFQKSSTGNSKLGYENYRLDLSIKDIARLTELDKSMFSGRWTLSSDNALLTLSELTPRPTGSEGSLQYQILSVSEKVMELRLTTTSIKTGGTTNEYLLESQ